MAFPRISRPCLSSLLRMHHSKIAQQVCQRLPCSSSASSSEKKTHFGYETVTEEEKESKVHEVFSKVASKYDLMNDVMSAGVHRLWKDHFIRRLDPDPGVHLLDVAGGTGDISFRFLDYIKKKGRVEGSHVTVCDINANMLEEGQRRAKALGYDDPALMTWVEGNAMNLPFESNSFDAYTIAFGIRNVVDIPLAVREAYRVLKPGGVFHCLEFSRVTNPLLEKAYDLYSFNLIPVYGEIFAGDWKSYQYLVESIRKFPDQQDFKEIIENEAFILVEFENLFQGISCIHSGYKPDK